MVIRWLKGSVGPADNDSRFLLDVHPARTRWPATTTATM